MGTAIRVASLNMNGFGSLVKDHENNKWGKIYRLMSEMRIGVLMLQETHLTPQRVADIHRMFAGRIKILFSAHPEAPTQKEGVAIVINRKILSSENVKMVEISPGRAIQVSIPWCGGDVRRLLCVYAPISEGVSERTAFFEHLEEYFSAKPGFPKPHIMAGDFNNAEDEIDRAPIRAGAVDASAEALDGLKRTLGLVITDGWRRVHPTERAYTFQRGDGAMRTMARLDRIYATDGTFKWAREWRILPVGVKTDHNLVSVLLTSPSAPDVGKGRPVFPLYLLKDKVLAKKMKSRGMSALAELEEITRKGRTERVNPQTVLYEMKKDWLKMARERERVIAPRLVMEIGELEKHLEDLTTPKGDGDLLNSHSDEWAATTEQLRGLKAKRTKQLQAKSRAKHRTEGESPTKYWTRMNKQQAPRQLVPAFEKENERTAAGELVYETNSSKMADMAKVHYDSIQADDRRRKDTEVALESLSAITTLEQRQMLAAPFAQEECELALRFAKAGTAPGLDGIQYEVWKTVQARFVEDARYEDREHFDVLKVLTLAYQDMHEYGVAEQTDFAEGWVSPIYKEKGERTKVVNYRPITLLNTDYKLLTKVMAVRRGSSPVGDYATIPN
ncbi:Endonuclease/exonuclease/phosphatase [Trametes maxima]|nr:Endonuclease/exonuclease/phosphatase [Trametes maxima]